MRFAALLVAILGYWNLSYGQSIVNVAGEQVTVSYGASHGVKAGMTAYAMGTEEIDGRTVEARIATIEIVSVSENQSVAKIVRVSSGYRITAGQRVAFAERLAVPKAAETTVKAPAALKTNAAQPPKPAAGRIPETTRVQIMPPDPENPKSLLPVEDLAAKVSSVQMPIEIPQDQSIPVGDISAPPNYSTSSRPGGGGVGPYVVGKGVKPPVILSPPLPAYKEEASNAGIEGVVLIQAIVHKDGTVDSFKVLRESTVQSTAIFDPTRNAAKDIEQAVAEAAKTGKRVLVDVGGNWCSWCHEMERYFEAHTDLRSLRDRNFVTVKVNWSPENQNEAVLSKYPKISGYPHLFVLDKTGTLLHSQDTGKLEDGQKSYDLEKFTAFLKEWAPTEK